ncbi:Alcohol dehydrogenase, C-terminal [Penicillium italicum]|uniref:Alcohol dehydrogenase, C-terminal n=1 Tax=Penicillium italicum TaxID=40296 RepID=A0A0A2LH26_PENIT|nr:Alcohol dehydrogenase, C-terminal [Penicillium italicum]
MVMADTMKMWQYANIKVNIEDAIQMATVDHKLPESSVGSISISRPAIPSLDLCGRVVAAHASVTAFKENQLVFAAECAALLDVVKPGATIFINGGSGGAGSRGVQFAKAMDARVVTSCSGSAIDMCKELGVDEVFNYRQSDVIADLKTRVATFDLVVDNVGNTSDLYHLSSTIFKPGSPFAQMSIGGSLDLGSIVVIIERSLPASLPTGGCKYYRAFNADCTVDGLKARPRQ